MKKIYVEKIVGIVVLAGVIGLACFCIKKGTEEMAGGNYYSVSAEFDSVSGLRPGASVEIAGVGVGKVKRINLDQKRYMAKVLLQINSRAKLPDDTVASIRTSGIIGDKFIELQQGNSKKLLADGGMIRKTESATDMEELIGEYIQGQV